MALSGPAEVFAHRRWRSGAAGSSEPELTPTTDFTMALLLQSIYRLRLLHSCGAEGGERMIGDTAGAGEEGNGRENKTITADFSMMGRNR
ncbi:hypothetical protein AMEX_G16540 [Astyanax mexicanus]|uniref:Uncharacterized protein n=1 Tax=Astyanax mexicanus TaxID=7994 RepID=A0A8T2LF68_ASTMX|nr:hypothetical protein AMEX_G16540 [Astyanax mexicanus]